MTNSDKTLQLLADYLAGLELEHQPEIYLSTDARAAPSVETWDNTIEAPKSLGRSEPLSVVFVDLVPEANFEHPVRYVFINDNTGDISAVEATTPPNALLTGFRKIELPISKAE